jgi:hypothetical protein
VAFAEFGELKRGTPEIIASPTIAGYWLQTLTRNHETFAFPILDPPLTDQPVLAIHGSYGRKTE